MKLSLKNPLIVILILITVVCASLFSYRYLTRHNNRESCFWTENLMTIDFEVLEFDPESVRVSGPMIDNKREHFRLDSAFIKVISPKDFKVFNTATQDYHNKFCIIGHEIPENHPLRIVGGIYSMIIDKNKIDNGINMLIEYIKSDIVPISPNQSLHPTFDRHAAAKSG